MKLIEFFKSRRKGIVVACLSLLAGVLAFSGTSGVLAYFSDAESTNNVFTVGDVKILLTEPNWPGNTSDAVKNLLPHQEVAKDPVITNDGINDAVVFMKLTVPYVADTLVNDDRTKNAEAEQELFYFKTNGAASAHVNDFNGNWVPLNDYTVVNSTAHTKTYVFGYKTRLQGSSKTDDTVQTNANRVTTPLFNKIQFRNLIEKSDAASTAAKQIYIDAYAIQADNIYDNDGAVIDTSGNMNEATLKKIYATYVNQNS